MGYGMLFSRRCAQDCSLNYADIITSKDVLVSESIAKLTSTHKTFWKIIFVFSVTLFALCLCFDACFFFLTLFPKQTGMTQNQVTSSLPGGGLFIC